MKKRRWLAAILLVCWGIAGICPTGDTKNLTKVKAAEQIVETTPSGEVTPTKEPAPTGEATPTQEPIPTQKPEEEKVHLGLDTAHVYEKMNTSFAQGYLPVIEGDTVHLTVPFTSSGELKDSRISVSLDLGEQAPFVYASYQKQVEKQVFTFEDQQVETYLYQCDIPLQPERINGSYPVIVKAVGYDWKGKEIRLEYRVFVTVTDGKDPSQKEESGELAPEEQQPPLEEDSMGDMNGMDAGFSAGGGGDESAGEEVTHQPKMLLVSNTLNGERVLAGEEKEITLTFKNSSREEKICNLKITGKAGEDTIALQTGSFYFESVAPQETIELTTTLLVSPAAEQKNIPLEFAFDYENDKGTAYTGTEQVGISVRQSVQAVMEGFTLPEKVYALENITAGLKIRNMGRAPVYNVRVELSGEGLFPVESIFAGNMEAGASFDGSMKIYVGNKKMETAGEETEGDEKEKYGSATGKLTLIYEDAFGETYTQEQEITTTIQKPQITELKVEKEKKETNQWWVVSLVLVVLLFAGILTIQGRKLKKNKDLLADMRARENRDEG